MPHPSGNPRSRLRWVACLATVIASLFALRCPARTIAVVGEAPAQFLAAAKTAGFDVITARNGWPESADAAILVASSPPQPADRRAFDAAAAALLKDAAGRLAQGKSLIVSFGDRPELVDGYDDLLPVNLWSVTGEKAGHGDLLRRGCGVTVPPGSPWAGMPIADGLQVSGRYDLHLPFAAIEAGEHRYRYQDLAKPKPEGGPWHNYDKSSINTDWQVLLNTDTEGRVPLLVSGRYGPGRVMVFGDSLFDPALLPWVGYGKFVDGLLSAAAPAMDNATPKADAGCKNLTLHVDRYQPDADDTLAIDVTNPGPADTAALLSYKISSAEHALLNSQTTPLNIPAGKTTHVLIRQLDAYTGDTSAETPEPYRFVHAAVLDVSRAEQAAEVDSIVDVAPAVGLDILGEDVRACDDLKSLPDRAMGKGTDMAGGASVFRYVYSTGQSPRLTIVIRNGLHDLAPLAHARDLGHPDNPTAQGLNDLAYSAGSIRGLMPSFGSWYGESAAEQRVALEWDTPVLLAASTIYGHTSYRKWDRCNPTRYELTATLPGGGKKPLAEVSDARYVLASHRDDFAPLAATGIELHVTGLDPSAVYEPGSKDGVGKSNCAIQEWAALGWPGEKPPAKVEGHLTVTATDVFTGKRHVLLDENVGAEPLAELARPVNVPAKSGFGPVRIDATFLAGGADIAHASSNVLFIPPGRKAIEPEPKDDFGLLCSPGFITFDPFGIGTEADTQGWGGPDDKVWAFTHDLLEEGFNPNNPKAAMDQPRRMMVSSTRMTHYTDPWRDFPSGEHFWDYAGDKLDEMVTRGPLKGHSTLHLMLSDRWNGINVGDSFTWADFIRFDEFLRKTTGQGLTGRTRLQIGKEIVEQHADVFQKYQMDRYADKLLALHDRLAAKGVDFTVTTHGSFPLVGGELGDKIGRTHVAVGTDLFWELKREDLYFTLGRRFGLIAANPDFESGAYNEFGWCSATMNNPHWFAYAGAVEPSRRQWYSTYFAGRVTSQGKFEPLTKFGFSSQGTFGPKQFDNDWQAYYRVQHLATLLRPEAPAGYGLVVSWQEQERHMGKKAGTMGFGLYAGEGFDNIDAMAGDVYERLIKNGLPISFVASTHTLQRWSGKNPLIVVDGYSLADDELADLDRLNAAGAPIIAVGCGAEEKGNARAEALFGVARRNGSWQPSQGTKVVDLGGEPLAFTTSRSGRGATLFCPYPGKDLASAQSASLADAIRNATGSPLDLSPGLTATTFVSNGQLFLAISDQGDVNRTVSVAIRPGLLAAGGVGFADAKVVDVETASELPAKADGARLTFTFPMAASDAHMIVITSGPAQASNPPARPTEAR
jgi:hypothetical protein